jgi:hypothetical protein
MNEVVERLNKIYSQVKIGGKVRIWDGDSFLTKGDFIDLEAGNGTWNNEGKKFIANSAIWLNSPQRNLFRRCTFYPGVVPGGTFNLWTGFPVIPKQGKSYNLFRLHLKHNVCNNNKDHFIWIWQWFAQIIKHPELKMGSALVLRGEKGVGKSIIFDVMGYLLGNAYTKISQEGQALGRFNSAMEGKVLCCLEEALWAGNKTGEGKLKDLITCGSLRIERKGLESYDSPNYIRIGIATNADWAVPVTRDERRFMVLNVGNDWKQNTQKFGAMLKELERGGYAGLMHDLIHTRIDPRIDLRNPPKTKVLDEQKKHSESPYVRWWREYVEDMDPEVWLKEIAKKELTRSCQLYFRENGIRQPFSNVPFFKELKKYIKPWHSIRKVNVLYLSEGRVRYIILPKHDMCLKALK